MRNKIVAFPVLCGRSISRLIRNRKVRTHGNKMHGWEIVDMPNNVPEKRGFPDLAASLSPNARRKLPFSEGAADSEPETDGKGGASAEKSPDYQNRKPWQKPEIPLEMLNSYYLSTPPKGSWTEHCLRERKQEEYEEVTCPYATREANDQAVYDTGKFLSKSKLKDELGMLNMVGARIILCKVPREALEMLIASHPPQSLVVQSPPRTGLTSSLALAMLHLKDMKERYPQILCVTPSRFVTYRILSLVERFFTLFTRKTEGPYPARPLYINEELKRTPSGKEILDYPIVLGEPNMILESIQEGAIDLRRVRLCVMKDADDLISRKELQDECLRIMENLPTSCRIAMATSTYEQELMDFAEHILEDPVIIVKPRKER